MSSTIQVAHIIHSSTVDGPGERAVLFVQGCPIHCPGCQSPKLQAFDGGIQMDVEAVAAELLDTGLPVTISGGEPFAQARAVADLLAVLRNQRPDLHIIVYSGFTLDDIVSLMPEMMPGAYEILCMANVLVDGPYIAELDHDKMQWRGSSNQRPINLVATSWWSSQPELVIEDWDTQVLTIDGDGDIVGTAGQMRELFEKTEVARMCGENPSSR